MRPTGPHASSSPHQRKVIRDDVSDDDFDYDSDDYSEEKSEAAPYSVGFLAKMSSRSEQSASEAMRSLEATPRQDETTVTIPVKMPWKMPVTTLTCS